MVATRKILVVDDEPEIRAELTEYLVGKGYEVTEAGDGLEAIEKFRADNFVAVITDMDMPRCPGNDLIGRLRQMNANVPIIVLTGIASFTFCEVCITLWIKSEVIEITPKYRPQEICAKSFFLLEILLPGDR